MSFSRNPVFDNWDVKYMESIVGACTICMTGGPGVDMGPADSLCATCIEKAYAVLHGEHAVSAAPTTAAGPDARTLDEIKAGVAPDDAAALQGATVEEAAAAIPYCGICEQTFSSPSALGSHNYQQKNKKHAGLVPTAVTPPDAPQEQVSV